MNLLEMETELLDDFGSQGTTDERTMGRFRRYLNSTYFRILGMKGVQNVRQQVLTFPSVANSPFCVLPQVCSKILTIQDRTNRILLYDRTMFQVRWDDPGLASSGNYPYEYVVVSYAAPCALDPSAADSLFLKSTSVDDNAGMTAYLQGILSNNYPLGLSQSMNGTTAVNVDATVTTWTQIKKFYLNGPAKGDVTLLQTSGAGTELARIPKGRSYASYTRIMLHPTPTAAQTYYADVELALDALLNDYDEPIIPSDYHWIIVSGARMREFKKKGLMAAWKAEREDWKEGLSALKLELARRSGPGQKQRARHFSQLGPNFGEGS